MNILLLIDNNLKHDNRVKRHLTGMLEAGHQVTVLAQPYPDDTPGFAAEGMELIFFEQPRITLDPHEHREIAERLGVLPYFFAAYPAGFVRPEALTVLDSFSRNLQARQFQSNRWHGFQDAICQDLDPTSDREAVLRSVELMLRWAEFACTFPADCIYCNDLHTFPAGAAHKVRYGSRAIFDAHEIYYDLAPGQHSRLFKQSLALLEQHLAPCADVMFGVSRSHVDWMRQAYNPCRDFRWVPNCVGLGKDVPPPAPRAPGKPLRLYYHGASDPFRGLDNIVQAVAQEPDVRFVMRCFPSPTLDAAVKRANELGAAERVQLLPLAGPAQLIDAIRTEADIGIHAHESPRALNIKVCLANKFIEYLHAGIPIITSPLQEQARIVQENEIGYVLKDNSPAEIRRGLRWAMVNRHRFAEMGQRAFEVGRRLFSWPAVKTTLLDALMR